MVDWTIIPAILVGFLVGFFFISLRTESSNPLLRRLVHFFTSQPSSTIIDLRVYPIKSCRGISVKHAKLQSHGLELDRQWMFVDAETREFLTIRQIPKMTLVNTALGGAGGKNLVLTITGSPKRVSIPAYPNASWLKTHTTLQPAMIWGHETDGYTYGADVNAMFSTFFERDVCLVYKGPTPRVLKGNGAPDLIGRTQDTYFPDVLPVQIASDASLRDLNSRLNSKGAGDITIERFRPNIIIKGNKPWTEDKWKVVQISGLADEASQDLRLDVVARCARCQVPNVDPDTADKDKHEPWDTLMSFRRVDPGITFKPCFGMLCVPRNEGVVSVGMEFRVLEQTSAHRYIKGF